MGTKALGGTRKERRALPGKGWLIPLLLCLAWIVPASGQGNATSSGQQLEALVTAEQRALDDDAPEQILASAKHLGFFALQLLGSLYARQGQCPAASESYRQGLSIGDSPEMLQMRVETELLLLTSELCAEHPDAADQVAAQTLQVTGDTAQIHELLATARDAGGDLPGAIAELKQAVALAPQRGSAHLALGNAYWELNEFQYNAESLREFLLARNLLPDDFNANENLGSLLSQYERYDEAAPYFEKAAQVNPTSPTPWLQLGMNAYAQNHTDQALTALGKAVALTGSNESLDSYQIRRAYAVLSRLETQRGKTAKATEWAEREQALRAVMNAANVDIPLTESTGVITDPAHHTPPRASPRGDAAEASSAETQALVKRLKQIVAKSLNDAGTVYARNRDFPSALPLFRLAASADPDQPPFMRNLGLAAFHTADYPTAIEAFTHALAQNPADSLVQNDLAQARSLAAGQTPASRP